MYMSVSVHIYVLCIFVSACVSMYKIWTDSQQIVNPGP